MQQCKRSPAPSRPRKLLPQIHLTPRRGVSSTGVAVEELKNFLNGKASIPGVQLRSLDRWNMIATLIAQGDPEANQVYETEKQRDHTDDAPEYSYASAVAKPDAATRSGISMIICTIRHVQKTG